MEQIFMQLAFILLVAFVVSYVLKLFKQPVIIGYILSGVIIAVIINFGFTGTKVDVTNPVISTFSSFGIALLLFIMGLHLNPKVIKEIGAASLIAGFFQIFFTFILSLFVSWKLLGFDFTSSIYVGIALSFSSTIIVMKLLSDRMQVDSLYGKISSGILIVQDLVAIIALMILSSVAGASAAAGFGLRNFILGIIVIGVLLLLGLYAMPRLLKSVANNQELLFLFSICWCFCIGALFNYLGFSVEMGALMAGIALSVSQYSTEISSKIRPLRDFFLIIFFVILGLNIQVANFGTTIKGALIFAAMILIIKSFVLIILLALLGYTKRTSFFTGITLAQISEFSFIVLALGLSFGHVNQMIVSQIMLAGIITILVSTYLVIYSNEIYDKIAPLLRILGTTELQKDLNVKRMKYDAILFGYNRTGFEILNSLSKVEKKYLVIDFNPETISNLQRHGIPCLYGDAYDSELLHELPLDKLQIAVSTIPGFETNSLLIKKIREVNKKAIIIARANDTNKALELYKKGASYVIIPHYLGGEHVSHMIKHFENDVEAYEIEKEKHIKALHKMKYG
jgi:Kef-type K+ transport system membrane component KefB